MGLSLPMATLGGSLLSSAFGFFGAKKQNKAAQAEAALNRDFQKTMSNTSYQRAAKDLKKAGLNRILAVKQGGASSPSGNAAPMVNTLTEAANSARSVATQLATIKNIEANTRKTTIDGNYQNKQLDILNTTGKSPVGDVINTAITSAGSLYRVSKNRIREPKWAVDARAKRKRDFKNYKIPTSGKARRKMISEWWNQ